MDGAGALTRTILHRASEAVDLDRTIATLATATRQSPVGFFCRGSESPWTRDLLRERGFVYTSNGFDDDLPYWDDGLLVRRPIASTAMT